MSDCERKGWRNERNLTPDRQPLEINKTKFDENNGGERTYFVVLSVRNVYLFWLWTVHDNNNDDDDNYVLDLPNQHSEKKEIKK